jgi:type I restriction enzyme M protein
MKKSCHKPSVHLDPARRRQDNWKAMNQFPAEPAKKTNYVQLVWAIAETLRGDFRPHQYGGITLPFVVLRRLECVLEPTRQATLDAVGKIPKGADDAIREKLLNRASKKRFHNTTKWTLEKLKGDAPHLLTNLNAYIGGFSANVRDVLIDRFKLPTLLEDLDKADLLFQVVEKFAEIDLHPDNVPNHEMGSIFEELIRRFAEVSNETAGEHFTPRDVVGLVIDLLFLFDEEILTAPGVVRTMYDPTAGTGGILSLAQEYLFRVNPQAQFILFGQEINPESYAVCKSDLLIKDQDPDNIKFGNTLSNDGLENLKADYMGANPPYGVDWSKIKKAIQDEFEKQGFDGRFGPGLPRVSDGSLLFVLQMISKMKDPSTNGGNGSRIAVVLNGSPLFTGGAGSGESNIRRWIIEQDLLESIIALPESLFYNTGIATYIWVLTNRKSEERRGKIQLINAVDLFVPMRKSLGDKRREISTDQRTEITQLAGEFEPGPRSKIFEGTEFGYRRITIERPIRWTFTISEENIEAAGAAADKTLAKLTGKSFRSYQAFLGAYEEAKGSKLKGPEEKALLKVRGIFGKPDPAADITRDKDGSPEPDPELRDTENVPLAQDINDYFAREVLPHVPDAWIDTTKRDPQDEKIGIVGYEINFNRHFYTFTPPRPLAEVRADMRKKEARILELLKEIGA